MFERNCNIHDYIRDEAEAIVRAHPDKCIALFRFTDIEDDEMSKDPNITATYAVTRKDLKNLIAHYKVIVYNDAYAVLHTDVGPRDCEQHTSLSKMLIGYSYL